MKKNKHVVVTGASGYIGCNLVKQLIERQYQVSIIVRKSSTVDWMFRENPLVNIYIYDGTIQSLSVIFQKNQIDSVFHLAASCITQHTENDIATLIDSNILFGTQLVEAMIQHNIINLVNTGTYWQHYDGPNYNPVALYAATKEAFETILKYYKEAHRLNVVTLKLFDIYGPNDSRSKIINLLMGVLKENTSIEMSLGEQYLDLLFIDDVVEAFICAEQMLMDKTNHQSSYFISSGKRIQLKELVKLIEKMANKKIQVSWGARPYRPREIMVPWCDNVTLVNWQPKISIEEGLAMIIRTNISVETGEENG